MDDLAIRLEMARQHYESLSDEELMAMSPMDGDTLDLTDKTPEALEKDFYEFVKAAWQIVEPETRFLGNWHIEAIARHLEALRASTFENLLINIPPGCSKSIVSCVIFPAWVWTTWPSARFLFASYDQELSNRDSVACRKLVTSDWYQKRWGHNVTLTIDQNSKERFDNTGGGCRIATTVGGRATGMHPDFIFADDPHNVKQATKQTPANRKEVKDWWSQTISTRGRIRRARRCVIMQRLHEDDLSGYLIGRGRFVHLCFPMRYEPDRMATTPLGFNDPRTKPGDLLWPAAFPESVVKSIEDDLGSLAAAGQLQQRPAPIGGLLFHREWFPIVPDFPKACKKWVRYWDKAASIEDDSDFSAGVLVGLHEGICYIADVVRGQWSSFARNQIIAQTAELDAQRFGRTGFTVGVEQEPGSGGKESAEFTVKQLVGFTVTVDKVTGEKTSRWQPFGAYAEAGNVRLVSGAWNAAFIDELVVAPFGKHDDQIDAASGGFQSVAKKRRFLVGTGG